MPYKLLELLVQQNPGKLSTEQCQIRKYYGRTDKYRDPLPITNWKMVPKGKDHFVISLISGILRFPCLFASGNHMHFTTANWFHGTEYFLDFVFDDKVAILENGDIWDTESHFANIFTSHDFWGKLYFLEKIHTEQIIWLFLWINVSGDNITSSKSHKSYRPLTSKSILMTLTRLYILWFHIWLWITLLFTLFSSYFISIQQIDFNQPIWISFGQHTLTHPELQFSTNSVEKLHQTEKNWLHSEHHI